MVVARKVFRCDRTSTGQPGTAFLMYSRNHSCHTGIILHLCSMKDLYFETVNSDISKVPTDEFAEYFRASSNNSAATELIGPATQVGLKDNPRSRFFGIHPKVQQRGSIWRLILSSIVAKRFRLEVSQMQDKNQQIYSKRSVRELKSVLWKGRKVIPFSDLKL
jgi:hypothetical protein